MKPILTLPLIFMSIMETGCAAELPVIVAHRGASFDAPENTMPAFERGWEQGADAIEGDFHLTRDGQIICIHDFNTKKVTGSDRTVKDTDFSELRKMDVGTWFGESFAGTTMPSLEEVMETVPEGKSIFIEIKSGPETLPALMGILLETELKREQLVVISFNAEVIKGVKKAAPWLKANWLSSFKVDDHGNLQPSAESVLSTLKEIGADGFSSKGHEQLDKAYIRKIQKAGYAYHVWTIDDPDEARRFQKLGVSSITTNRPAYIREALSN